MPRADCSRVCAPRFDPGEHAAVVELSGDLAGRSRFTPTRPVCFKPPGSANEMSRVWTRTRRICRRRRSGGRCGNWESPGFRRIRRRRKDARRKKFVNRPGPAGERAAGRWGEDAAASQRVFDRRLSGLVGTRVECGSGQSRRCTPPVGEEPFRSPSCAPLAEPGR